MSDKLSVLILGGTGYIGGSVLVELAKRHPELHRLVTVVRKPADNAAFESYGNVKVVNGSLSDLEFVEKLVKEYDVVISCADSDNLPSIKAILAGLEERAKEVERKPILIHTSGTGLLIKETDGAFHDDKIYDDGNVDDIKSIPDNAFHRDVDLEILNAGKKGLIDAYIVAPSTVYGKGRGPLRRLSIQINSLIRLALKHKEVLQAGPGTNVWTSVHIDDLANFYVLLFEWAISGKDKSTDPFERFYWASGDEYVWGEVAREVGKLLYASGEIKTPTPRSSTVQEEPVLLYSAGNSRAAATRAANTFGWKIEAPSLWETLPGEVEWTVADFKATQK